MSRRYTTSGTVALREVQASLWPRAAYAAGDGATGVAQGSTPTVTSAKGTSQSAQATTDDYRIAFTFKVRDCTNCGACVDACRKYNHTPEGMPARRKLTTYIESRGVELYVATSCMHCENPACVAVCPAGAIYKRADGIVALDSKRCIGCKYCYSACPFGVPHYTDEVMDKCDFCLGNGVEPCTRPRCALACPTGALDAGRTRDVFARAERGHGSAEEGEGGSAGGSEGGALTREVFTRIEATTIPSMYLA